MNTVPIMKNSKTNFNLWNRAPTLLLLTFTPVPRPLFTFWQQNTYFDALVSDICSVFKTIIAEGECVQ